MVRVQHPSRQLVLTMISSETQITNLLFRYAEMLDDGDMDGVGEIFAHARVKFDADDNDGALDAEGLRKVWDRCVIRYPDGTPRSKHVTTNPIIEVDEEAGTATVARTTPCSSKLTDCHSSRSLRVGTTTDSNGSTACGGSRSAISREWIWSAT